MKPTTTATLSTVIIFGSIALTFAQIVEPGFAPDIAGGASAIVLQPDGRILIGGNFSAVNGLVRSNLARLFLDGSIDLDFAPDVNERVNSIALQTDGKLLAGGSFTAINGEVHTGVARLNRDGSLAPDFTAGITDPPALDPASGVKCLALQPDGKILVGGVFNGINGQLCPNIARLNSDGSVDTNFSAQADSSISCIALQPDGKVLVAGSFLTVNQQPRMGIARLQPDGTLDSNFTPAISYPEYSANCVLLQPDGRMVVAGAYSSNSIVWHKFICRLDPNGGLDPQFFQSDVTEAYLPDRSYFIAGLALQADRKILVGGHFGILAGEDRANLGRLNSNGTLDSAFTPTLAWTNIPAGTAAFSLASQPDGNLIVSGTFSELSGQARAGIGRLLTDATPQESLSVNPGGTGVRWNRSGSQPEVAQVTFESSSDGTNYAFLGSPVWTNGQWQLAGLSLPFGRDFYLRARGRTISGSYAASSGLLESLQHFVLRPVISQIAPHPSGGFSLSCFSSPNRPCILLATQTLGPRAEWTPIATNLPSGDGGFVVRDLPPSESTQRLYKLWLP